MVGEDGVDGEERLFMCVDRRGEEVIVGSQGKSRHCWCQKERRKKKQNGK